MGRAVARAALTLALLLVLAGAGGAPTVVGQETVDQAANGEAPSDGTVIRITLREDGGARWNVSTYLALEDETDRRAFDRLDEEFEAGELDAPSVEPFRRAAERAERVTARPMEIRAVDRTGARSDGVGRLSLAFTWTNFTRTDGGTIELGDAFRTPEGTWLPELTADQELIIEFPPDYAVRSSSRALTNGTFHVRGPATFEPGEPSATLRRTGAGQLPGNGPTTSQLVGLVVLAVSVTALAVYVAMRRRRGRLPVPGRRPTDGEGPAGDADDRGPAEEAAASGGPEAANEGPEGGEPAEPPTEGAVEPLLSDEERVERLLRREGGRMKQVDIVAETGWSNAKVSQLLSAMDEAGRIEKLRIGRENLISLPERGTDED